MSLFACISEIDHPWWMIVVDDCYGSCLQCEVGEVKTFTVVRALARHRVLDILLGPQHSCVLVEPGHVYTLGCNAEAQLGSGSTRPHVAPISVKLFQQRHAVVSAVVRLLGCLTRSVM